MRREVCEEGSEGGGKCVRREVCEEVCEEGSEGRGKCVRSEVREEEVCELMRERERGYCSLSHLISSSSSSFQAGFWLRRGLEHF